MSEILIRGLKITSCHGVHDYEKVNPQPFVFDVDMGYDFYAAYQTDGLDCTVNYSAACNLIAEKTKSACYNLIEKLAYECAYALMDAFALEYVKLTVYKPQAPVKHDFKNVGVSVELKRESVYLSLGSNLGDRESYLKTALDQLAKTRGIRVKKVSSFMTTEPYGGVAHGEFVNCAAEVQTFLPPEALLTEIHRIERECGRVRDKRWGDRTLDIDIIFYGRRIINTDELTVPHADYSNRNFVLSPLAEIAPDFVCPVCGKRIKELKASYKM